jgi:DNA-binding transcriptional LysR family regulator
MELRHLRYFLAVAEELHFGRAAERLAIAQPPLSQQIQALERELGVALFTRGPVRLTPAGEAFQREARATLDHAERAAEAARAAARGELGTLRVGFVSSVAYGSLPQAVRLFRERNPRVALTLTERTTAAQLMGLHAGDLDVGFFRMDYASLVEPDLLAEPIAREPYVLALPVGHRLAALERVPLAEAAPEPFISFPKGSSPSLHGQIERYCLRAGFTPRIVQETTLMQTIIALVAAGLGVALVPGSLRRLQLEGVVYRPLVEADVHTELVAVRRRNDGLPALDAFLASVREAAS